MCRRDGVKLFLKGPQCFSDKCPVDKRNFPPGQHGQSKKRRRLWATACSCAKSRRPSASTSRLRRPVPRVLREGRESPGVTGDLLLQQLETRLDNVAYRLGFAISRRQARQVVRHGHVAVNGRKVNIPSFQCKVGDVIAIREKSKEAAILESAEEFAAGRSRLRGCRSTARRLPAR